MPRSGRLFAQAVLLILPGLGPVGAANENIWHWRVLGDDVQPYLTYEASADQDHRFALICDNQQRTAEVTVPAAGKRPRRGQPVTIELTAGGQTVTMKASIRTDNGIYGHVSKAPYKAVVTLLRRPGPVSVRMIGNSQTLGDEDRVKRINEFTSACKLK